MTREQMIELIDFIMVIAPQQRIDRATAVPWYEVIGHLDFDTARAAVIAVKHSQAFVDTSDIIREASRARSRHTSDRTPAAALEHAHAGELAAAAAVPPTPEYLEAKAGLDERMAERARQTAITDARTARQAEDWINYKLGHTRPPAPLGGPPVPRWTALPGDPPELQAWLSRQPPPAGPDEGEPG